MSTKSQRNLAVLERRQRIANLYVQGWAQSAIALEIGASQPTISDDLKEIRKQWRESAVRDFDMAVTLELQKLDRLEREAWAAWERSQKPAQSAVISGDAASANANTKTRRATKQQHGDARFLEVVHKCIAQRRALLGLDTTTASEAQDVELAPNLRRDRLLTVLATIRDREPMEANRAGLGGEQSGTVCDDDQPG